MDDEFVPRPPPLRDGVPLTLSYSTLSVDGVNGRFAAVGGKGENDRNMLKTDKIRQL